jgi:metal-dependent hydrolase (beta-lactamase superfamily II)
VRILILYDNVAQPPLREGWGFSALTEILVESFQNNLAISG